MPRGADTKRRYEIMNPSFWLMAARPRTLGLSITPVAVGAALSWAMDGRIHQLAVAAALVASMFIQMGTNLHNDAVDSERGGDGPDRVGPPRVTALGLLSGRNVKHGACTCFGIAALMGFYLIAVGGWPIFVLGILSIAAGWAYTGGPWPIAYTPLGEIFVVFFFGLGAVGGTYWLCASHLTAPVLEAGLALGLITGAVLLVNNFRDREADARVGRRTLAIVAGPGGTAAIYAAMMLVPFALLFPITQALPRGQVWPALLPLPLAALLINRFIHAPTGPSLNGILLQTVQIQALFSLLLALGLIL